jgi:Mor family transcriptional regulator
MKEFDYKKCRGKLCFNDLSLMQRNPSNKKYQISSFYFVYGVDIKELSNTYNLSTTRIRQILKGNHRHILRKMT